GKPQVEGAYLLVLDDRRDGSSADLEALPIESTLVVLASCLDVLGASSTLRNLPGLAGRDRLVLLALVTTGLRRSELCALDWRDLALDGPRPSMLVRRGKGGKPRRQPLAPQLAAELRQDRKSVV